MKNWKRGIKLAAVSTMCALVLSGCTKSSMVNHNVSKEADNFNVERKITVINVRNNQVLYELTGTFSMQNSDKNELTIISEVGKDIYKKDFIYLSEWTTYIVQDVSGADVDPYHYEVSILPESLVGGAVTPTLDCIGTFFISDMTVFSFPFCHIGTLFFALGFSLMMILDVCLVEK